MVTHNYDVFRGSVDDKQGRVFFRPGALTADEAGSILEDSLCEPEDTSRLDLLRRGLSERPVAIFATHRTLDAPDVIQAFLRMIVDGDQAKVFACTVQTLSRVKRDLEQGPFVVEGLSLQVASTAATTHASLETALHAWCERVFPDVQTPRVVLDPWRHEVEDPDPTFVEMVIRTTEPVHRAEDAGESEGFWPPATLTDDSVRETAA